MPLDHRRGGVSHVASSLTHRQRSRRRIAAVSFLSNISLDGSHRDTNLRQFTTLSDRAVPRKDFREVVEKGVVEFHQIPMETVDEARIPDVTEVHVKTVTSTEGSAVSSNDMGQSLGKSHNPNLNWNIGPLDKNASIVHKRSHVVSTLEKCANVSLNVVTRVRSLTLRSTLTNSVGNSINSISNSVPLVEQDEMDGKPAKRRGVDKENSAPSTGLRNKVDSSAGDWENVHKDKQATRRRKPSSHTASGSSTTQQGVAGDKGCSSCESLVPPGSEKAPRKPSGSVSESSSGAAVNCRDVRVVRVCRSTNSASARSSLAAAVARQAIEGRVLLTTGRGAPVHVFSVVHDRSLLGGGAPRPGEGPGRKRNVSGTRQLATIADTSDPPPEGGPPPVGGGGKAQEMSYSHLLVSSPHYMSGRPSDMAGDPCQHPQSAPTVLTQHAVSQCQLARCFSHDPAMAAGTQAMAAGTQAISNFHQPLLRYDYSPDTFDSPELRAGRHRKLLRFPSYLTSLLDYTKPDELKRELNEKFRARFPHVRVTLSKLRSLKREMVYICQQSYSSSGAPGGGSHAPGGGEALLTVALAQSYFDSLCLSGAVHKTSRKLLAGACLLISAKLNDLKGDALVGLIEKIESQFRLERNELLSAEFTALLSLQFSIHAPTVHVNTRYQRLLFEH